jgi:hypothetical protein
MRDRLFEQAGLIVIGITIGLIGLVGGLAYLARLLM